MIILVQGLYKDEVKRKVFELSERLKIETINCGDAKDFESFLEFLNEFPDAILYNTWIDLAVKEKENCLLKTDEIQALSSYVHNSGGFAYYLTSEAERLLSKFDKDDVRNYDYMMVQTKMFMPVVAYNCDETSVEPADVKIS